jgi:hypothetical protein
MEWIQLFFVSVLVCFPFYIIGALVCGVAWYFTRRWHVFLKVITRSFLLALLLAPGAIVGHGFAPVPAALAVLSNLIDGRTDTAFRSSVPIFVVWLVSACILFAIAHFTKKTDETAA